MDTQQKIDKLRAIADWLEANELPDTVHVIIGQGPSLNLHTRSIEDMRTCRRLTGVTDKDPWEGRVILRGRLPGVDVEVSVWAPEGSCKQVQVGVERRPVMIESGTYESVPVYEWDCGPVLTEVPA